MFSTMKPFALVVLAGTMAVFGLAGHASAVVTTRIDWQVATLRAGPWSSTLVVPPASTVYAGALVSYSGSGPVAGLASFVFQPTVSNWIAGDVLLPFVNGGIGSNTSTPPGVVTESQLLDTTSFGRI